MLLLDAKLQKNLVRQVLVPKQLLRWPLFYNGGVVVGLYARYIIDGQIGNTVAGFNLFGV